MHQKFPPSALKTLTPRVTLPAQARGRPHSRRETRRSCPARAKSTVTPAQIRAHRCPQSQMNPTDPTGLQVGMREPPKPAPKPTRRKLTPRERVLLRYVFLSIGIATEEVIDKVLDEVVLINGPVPVIGGVVMFNPKVRAITMGSPEM
jgi:hypothetical protein